MNHKFMFFWSLFFIFSQINTFHTESTQTYSLVSQEITNSKIKLKLQYQGNQTYFIKPSSPIIKNLIFQFKALTFYDFTFKIYDSQNPRFQVYQGGLFPIDNQGNFTYPLNFAGYQLNYTKSPFTFQVIRKTDGSILFSSAQKLIFSQLYIEITTKIDSNNIFGLGSKQSSNLKLKPGKWTLFNRYRQPILDNGEGIQGGTYHPAYLLRQKGDNYHISYFRTSQAMDVIIQLDQYNISYSITYKTIGGIIDFRFFLESQLPEPLLAQFNQYAGKSPIPPFWALGYHQASDKYNSSKVLLQVIENFKKNRIPLDSLWLSQPSYNSNGQPFTLDISRFNPSDMQLIQQKYKMNAQIKPYVPFQKGNAFKEGQLKNIFIKNANNKDFYIGKNQQNTSIVYIDFFNPNITEYLKNIIDTMKQTFKFSAIEIKGNEPYNNKNANSLENFIRIDYSQNLPYNPGNDPIQTNTLSLNSTYYGKNNIEANVHTFYGHLSSALTYQYLASKESFPFLITGSSSIGTNKYSHVYQSQNIATFQFLKSSPLSILSSNIWGQRMAGSSICGYKGNTSQELCTRWYQLSVLNIFTRNHNQIYASDKEPYNLGEKVLNSARKNLQLKYSLLKTFYRQFLGKMYRPLIKPLFFNYLQTNILEDSVLNTQFLIGNSLMCTPILEQKSVSREVYFPYLNKTRKLQHWYDFYNGKAYKGKQKYIIHNEIDAYVPLFIREGAIVLVQNTENVTSTNDVIALNRFNFIGGMEISKKKRNFNVEQNIQTTNSTFSASNQGTLSLADYNDEIKLKKCIATGCQYQFQVELEMNKEQKYANLTLNVVKVGTGVSDPIVIQNLTFYLPTEVISYQTKTGQQITLKKTQIITRQFSLQTKPKVQQQNGQLREY